MKLLTIEQVSKWHPDKYADQISDRILSDVLSVDTDAHCGIEVMVKDTTVVVGGEVTAKGLDKKSLGNLVDASVKIVASNLGYDVTKIINLLNAQSLEINRAVSGENSFKDDNGETGAGDQGIMIGYSYNTDGHPIERKRIFAHKELADNIISQLACISGKGRILKGDAKCQVTFDADSGKIMTIIVSVCHEKGYSLDTIRVLVSSAINTAMGKLAQDMFTDTKVLINPAGEWTVGGPLADSGVTGRKLVCDAYGPQVQIGGGAQSGKDTTKVDRTAFYMAKYISKVLVRKFDVDEVKVELSYVIGDSVPVSVNVDSSNPKLNNKMTKYVLDTFDLRPRGMIRTLKLDDPEVLNYILIRLCGYEVLWFFDMMANDTVLKGDTNVR